MKESVLLVPVPEVEDLIGHFRARYDPSAREGVPAHITLLYPFVPGDQIDSDILRQVAEVFREVEPFRFELSTLARFPETLYLAPTPAEPFRLLTATLASLFPDYHPYGGAFDEVVPHLTVAHTSDRELLERLEVEVPAAVSGQFPIPAIAREVRLMTGENGVWTTSATFPLSSVRCSDAAAD